jgi:hypothetical protein
MILEILAVLISFSRAKEPRKFILSILNPSKGIEESKSIQNFPPKT